MNALSRIIPRFGGGNAGPTEPTWLAPAADTGQGYRVAWWMAWLFAVYSVVATLAVITLGLLVVKLSAVHEIVPMLLTVGPKADQIVRVEPYEVRTKGFGLFVETLLKGYVQKRETIDLHTEVPRWQEVNWMSSDEVWNAFKQLMEKSNRDSPFERYKREGVTRGVHVSVVTEVSPNVYRVEWSSEDSRLTEPRGHGHWISTITIAFQEKAVRLEDRYMNPIGLQVVGYSVDHVDDRGAKS
jgi:type IV secretion system protein VirB8